MCFLSHPLPSQHAPLYWSHWHYLLQCHNRNLQAKCHYISEQAIDLATLIDQKVEGQGTLKKFKEPYCCITSYPYKTGTHGILLAHKYLCTSNTFTEIQLFLNSIMLHKINPEKLIHLTVSISLLSTEPESFTASQHVNLYRI